MVRPFLPFLIALFACTSLSAPASANDSTALLEAGGLRLVSDAPVEMISEVLRLAPERVDVTYRFRAADGQEHATLVAFPMPEFDFAWLGYSGVDADGPDMAKALDFLLWVDGVRIIPALETKALRNGIDVTDRLNALAIPVASVDVGVITERLSAMSQDQRDWLAEADLVRDWGGGDVMPLWTTKATYYWRQVFPAGRDVEIRHSYRPITGKFFLSDQELREVTQKEFCMGAAEVKGVQRRLDQAPHNALMASHLRYVLRTGANWRGTIGSFTLIVDKASPEALVSLCFDGLRKIAPTVFEATRHDFIPERDLDVLFLTPLPQ